MKKVKDALKAKDAPEETITAFEKGAQAYAKKIVANFKDYDFYIGESMDPDGMYVVTRFDYKPFAATDCHQQGHPHELPRGWNHSFRHSLEAWVGRDEGLRGLGLLALGFFFSFSCAF